MENGNPAFRNKVMIAGGVVVLALLTILIMRMAIPQNPAGTERADISNARALPTSTMQRRGNPTPTLSAQLQKAIQVEVKKQQAVEQEYSTWQNEVRNDFPWRVKLPLHSDQYYVYFDINKKEFIGYLYPKSSDNVEQMKAVIVKILKEQKGIPVDSYPFGWTVSVQK
jgi:hypothetical protein